MSRAQILILGSGTPNAEADRVSSGAAIAVDGQPYLVDCGHGIVQRVVQAQAAGLVSWGSPALTRLFVTHLHADHTVGLPDLLYTPWIHGRTALLEACGPAGLADMLRHIQLAYAENIREHRAAHPVSERGCLATAREVTEGRCYHDENLSVWALPADHGDLAALSYKFVTPAGTVVISGDTKPVPAFADWARGCDVLIHEVYSSARFPERPPAWQAYHSRAHTSTRELAAWQTRFGPGACCSIINSSGGRRPPSSPPRSRAAMTGRSSARMTWIYSSCRLAVSPVICGRWGMAQAGARIVPARF